MFCPNCDRVYVKRTVCPHCGVELLRAKGKPEKKVVTRQNMPTNAAGVCCPKCGSTNYSIYRAMKYRPNIKNGQALMALLTATVYLYFLLRGWNKYYCCNDCEHEWVL